MFEGIKLLDGNKIINIEDLPKNENGQYLLEGIGNLKVYLEDGAKYDEKIQVQDNDSDVLISLLDANGNEIDLVLLSLSEILLTNQDEIPVFEVFNGSEKLVSMQSIDDLEAAAAGNTTLTSAQTSDFGESEEVAENETASSGENLEGFSRTVSLDSANPTYSENITFSGDLSSDITEDFADNGNTTLSGVITNDDPHYGTTAFVPQTTTTEYGVFTLDEAGNWTYELFADNVQDLQDEELLSETFTVEVLGKDATTLVEVDISGINDAPTIEIRDEQSVDEDGELSIPFSVSDAEGDEVTTNVSATNGTVEIVDGEIVFTPEENYNGPATITITLDDGNGGVTTKTVNVSVEAVNDVPVADPLNIEVTEDSLEDVELVLGSNEDTTYNGQLVASDVDGDNLSFSKVGVVGLTISTTNEEFLAAVTPGSEDLDYVKSVLLEIVNIPEVTYALTNNLNSVGINVTELIAQFQGATDVTTALALVTNALGVSNASLVPTATGLDLVIEDASALEAEGLLNVDVDSDGSYAVTSPLFNYLSVDDNVEVTFDYSASDDVNSLTETVTLNVSGSNDALEIEGLFSAEEASSWSLIASGVSISELESFVGDTISNSGSSPYQGSALAVTIDAKEGEIINFKWDFEDIESLNTQNTNDFAFVLINGVLTTLEDVLDTDVDGNTVFSHAFTDAGQYDFVFGVVNSLDSHYDSELYVEHVSGGTIISSESIGNVSELNVSSLEALSVDENTDIGTVIGQVEATDTDILDTVTYLLVNPSDEFEIDPETGEIKVISELDYETQSEYEIEVKISDGNGSEEIKSVVVNVANINEVPIVETISSIVNEEDLLDIELPAGSSTDTTFNGQIIASDVDVDDSISYARAGAIGLTINTVNAELIAALTPATADLDYVKATLSEIVAIPEVQIALTNNLNAVENMDVATLIAQFQAASTVQEALGLVTNALGLGNASLVPTATGLSLVVEDASALEAEGLLNVEVNSDGTYSVTSPLFDYLSVDDSVEVNFDYSADDGEETSTDTVNLIVNGTNDAPVLGENEDTLNVDENTEIGTIIGQVNATDIDILDNVTYSLVNPSDEFEIDPETGEIKVISELDYETQNEYEIEVKVSDGNGAEDTVIVKVAVNDIPQVIIEDSFATTLTGDGQHTGTLEAAFTRIYDLGIENAGKTVDLSFNAKGYGSGGWDMTSPIDSTVDDWIIIDDGITGSQRVDTPTEVETNHILQVQVGEDGILTVNFDGNITGGLTEMVDISDITIKYEGSEPELDIEVEALNTKVIEETLLDIPLTASSNTDTTYEGQIQNVSNNDINYSRVGVIGLTISTDDANLVSSLTPGTADLDYVKSILAEIVAIPEVTLALTNNLNSVPNMDVSTLVTQFQTAVDIPSALGLVTNALGLSNANLVSTTSGLELVIEDASSLETEGLLNVEVNGDGSYIVTSPLFNHLSVSDSVKVNFDYFVSDGIGTGSETVTLEVIGSNDTSSSIVEISPSEQIIEDSFATTLTGDGQHTGTLEAAFTRIYDLGIENAGKTVDLSFNAKGYGSGGWDMTSPIDSTVDDWIIIDDGITGSQRVDTPTEVETNHILQVQVGEDGILTVNFDGNITGGLTEMVDISDITIKYEGLTESLIMTSNDPDINDTGIINMAELLSNTEGLNSGELDEVNLLQGNHILSNISVEDVLSITDTDNTLEITGDTGDKLLLDLGSEVSDISEIQSGDLQWHKDTSASTASEEVYVGKTSTDETITLLINGINVEDV